MGRVWGEWSGMFVEPSCEQTTTEDDEWVPDPPLCANTDCMVENESLVENGPTCSVRGTTCEGHELVTCRKVSSGRLVEERRSCQTTCDFESSVAYCDVSASLKRLTDAGDPLHGDVGGNGTQRGRW